MDKKDFMDELNTEDVKDELIDDFTIGNENFTHTHVHLTYSFLDGFNFIDKAIEKVKSLNMTSLAITDHNHLGGVVEFQSKCKKEGIKPLLGLETYWTKDTSILSLPSDERNQMAFDEAIKNGVTELENKKIKKSEIKELIKPYQYDTKQYHLILIATSQKGWSNLVKLQSEAARLCTFNGRFCCDDELLKKYNEDIIMTNACIGSYTAEMIIRGNIQEAENQIKKWVDIFGDRFYLEIQPLNIQKQRIVNYYYAQWSKKYNLKIVATTDCHYTNKEDWDDHDTLICIGTGRKKSEVNRMKYSNDYWIKSYKEMIEGFCIQANDMENDFGKDLFNKNEYIKLCAQALETTNEVADRVSEDIKLGSDVPLVPKVTVPNGMSADDYFTLESYKGLYKYKKKHPEIDLKVYEERLNSELKIIKPKGYSAYMLIVKEFVEWCREKGIPVGPGRGSAAGSLCLFTNGITKVIDPIKYHLLFFRFLTADRTAPPDIDLDFAWSKRQQVIQHLKDVYGENHVAHIGTYTSEGVKSGLKDVARTLDIPFDVINNITKEIDDVTDKEPGVTFKWIDDMKDSVVEREREAYKKFHQLEEDNKELFRLARKFEGCHRNAGVHASGILITPIPVTDLVPVRYVDGTAVTLYTGAQLEELNFLKFDILGLKTLDVLDITVKSIDPNMTVNDLYELVEENLNDKKMFQMVRGLQTDGLFQIESDLFKGMIEDIQPTDINDIIVLNSLG